MPPPTLGGQRHYVLWKSVHPLVRLYNNLYHDNSRMHEGNSLKFDGSTLEPRYNAPLYSAISDLMLFFLGSQIIFKKYL